ncbi:hypothetical protein BMR09_15330, partial [Methylococcaceae bacterium CS3]
QKTHRQQAGGKGFNAMFAVSSVDAAKVYYESFKNLQKMSSRPLFIPDDSRKSWTKSFSLLSIVFNILSYSDFSVLLTIKVEIRLDS